MPCCAGGGFGSPLYCSHVRTTLCPTAHCSQLGSSIGRDRMQAAECMSTSNCTKHSAAACHGCIPMFSFLQSQCRNVSQWIQQTYIPTNPLLGAIPRTPGYWWSLKTMSEAQVQPETQAVSVQVLSYSLYSRHFHMIIVIVKTCHLYGYAMLRSVVF